MKRWATIPIALLALILLWPAVAKGQGVTTGSMRGQVTDADGEPLPGANVIAVHQPSGTRYGTSTNENGRYNLANMRVGGPYQVTASFVGYQSERETGIELGLGETQRINFDLREETAELDEVEVVAERGALAGEKRGIGTRISSADIEATPTQGRKLADITRLVPQSYVANNDDDGPAVSFAGQSTDFNSIFIDGAVSNDVFGLSAQGTDGGQTGATPISLSALEAFNVDVSPYDVTQSGFTGAAINAVTKSGSNEFEGKLEYYRRDDALSEDLPTFSSDRAVLSVGGPIVKDKLFFFVNADVRRSDEPQPLEFGPGADTYQGRNLSYFGPDGEGNSNNVLDGITEIRQFVRENTGYDPGGFGTRNTTVESDKALVKLDYNVAENHRLTARYFYTGTENVDQFQSTRFEVNFGNSAEVFPNDTHNFMLQWNGSFGDNVSTKTIATYKSVTDDRGVRGEPFANMTIFDGPNAEVNLGSEPFSQVNFLGQDVYTFTNTTDIFLGDHTITLGTHNEFYQINNKFAVFSPGLYEFNPSDPDDDGVNEFSAVENFARTVCDYARRNEGLSPNETCQTMFAPGEIRPVNFYLRQYSLVDDNPNTEEFESFASDRTNLAGQFDAIQLGFYAQDQWQVTNRLDVTYGLRVNFPKLLDDPRAADDANSNTLQQVSQYYDLEGARAGDTPDWRPMIEPRAGFTWDVNGDQSTKLRGGVGVFTSRLPFVWPASMYTNNGVSSDFLAGLNLELRRPENAVTRPEPGDSGFFFGGTGVGVDEIVPTGNLHIMQDDFMYPRVLRTSLGIDQELPLGLVGTIEGQFSNQLKNIVVENVNLLPPNETMDGPDNRPIYAYAIDGNVLDANSDRLIDPRYGDILRVRNTSRGYSYNFTTTLNKPSTRVGDNTVLSGRVSYSYGNAFSIQSYGGDTIGSLWDENEHVNGTNNLDLARSEFSQGHSIQVSANWRQEFSDNFALTTSVFYTGVSGRPFSYTIGGVGDAAGAIMIGDDGASPLFYIPQSASQLTFQPITDDEGNVLRTVAEQRADVEQFISNVDYLDSHRGEYASRNADRTPFEGVVDLKFSAEIFGDVLDRQQSIRVNFDIFNFSALAGSVFNDLGFGFGETWGDRYLGQGSYDVVEFAGYQDPNGEDSNPNNDFVPVYQSALGTDDVARNKEDIFTKRTAGSTYSSRYQVQFGIEYSF